MPGEPASSAAVLPPASNCDAKNRDSKNRDAKNRDAVARTDLRARVAESLTAFLQRQSRQLERLDPDLAPITQMAAEFLLCGGKRLRPAFCYWGWRGAGGEDCDAIVDAAASLELLHACALIHDDVMDSSDTRRGRPSAHRRLAGVHRERGWLGDPAAFGRSSAVLLGDLFLVWADQMLSGSDLPDRAVRRAWPLYAQMRVELMAGQYMDIVGQATAGDIVGQATGGACVERSLRVARYKSAKYTVERPLQVGGLLAGAGEDLLAVYSAYGVPLGEAFQLRDDVLGVFGDPAVTGKPAGDDLREGKRTALVAYAGDRANPTQARTLRRLLGDPGLDARGVDTLREVIIDTGALHATETLIADRTRVALAALDRPVVDARARGALRELAVAATTRRL